MRRVILIATLLTCSMAFAKEKAEFVSVEDFYKTSKELHKKASKEKNFNKRTQLILELESDFKKSLDEFEKETPDEAGSIEKDISLLFETLEPAFTLAKEQSKPNAEKCGQARLSVEAGDSMGRGENPPLTKQAKETIEWIKVLCK